MSIIYRGILTTLKFKVSLGGEEVDYTYLSNEDKTIYEKKLQEGIGKPSWGKLRTLSKKDPTIFAKSYLNILPFDYQDQVLNDPSERIIVCSSRQIGKTYVVAIKALHFAMFNPNKTILVFSKNQNQSKKFLREIKRLMYEGMVYMNHTLEKQDLGFKPTEENTWMFPEDIDNKKPNNQTEFTLTNGTTIMSLPATDSSRGYTAHLVIVDEAAFVPDEIFDMIIEPTVRYTGGSIILLSTPNGQKGFFHRFFDPEDKSERDENDPLTYKRYWWNWNMCPEPNIRKQTERKRKELDPIRFLQEYEAQFTSDGDAFFQSRKVKEAIDPDLEVIFHDLDHEYVCGIDYGMVKSRTVVSLCRYDEEKEDIILAYQKEFPPQYDNANLKPFLTQLETQFNIIQYVVDDCPQGDIVNKQMVRDGKNVFLFNFRREKTQAYFKFKSALNKRFDEPGPRVRYPDIKDLIIQLLSLQIGESKRILQGFVTIQKPSGGWDDRVDSFVMAAYPFLREEQKKFRSYLA